jgi:hypothetical protein
MPHYRVYVLDNDGQLTAAVDLACADDDRAREQANHLAEGQEVQLWRLVPEFTFPPHRLIRAPQ